MDDGGMIYFSFSMPRCLLYLVVQLLLAAPIGSYQTALAHPPDIGPKVKRLSVSFPRAYSDSSTSVIPFNRAGNLIVVQARVDTTVGNFILDTGAPSLVLNITYFRD